MKHTTIALEDSMTTRKEQILRVLGQSNGLTDRELTERIDGRSAKQQPINQICRRMADEYVIERKKRKDGLIGNYLISRKKIFSKRGKSDGSAKPDQRSTRAQVKTPNQTRSEGLGKLIALGFEHAGDWFLDGQGISYVLTKASNETNILYAFVDNGEVNYIGKSKQTLRSRINGYKNAGESQKTNIRIREKIKRYLESGSKVAIYVFIQKAPMTFKDIPINLAAGLEDNLISLIKPKWNIL